MSNSFVLLVPMPPHGKERPRFGQGKARMSDVYVAWKRMFAWHARSQWPGPPWVGPLSVQAVFVTPTGSCRSDGDNALGSVLDALEGIAYANDRAVKAGGYRLRKGTLGIQVTIERLPP